MNKNDIDHIEIAIECGGESALSMMLHRDGTTGRSGSGSLPSTDTAVLGIIDQQIFKELIDSLHDGVFPHAGTYEIKNKIGTPVMYRIIFLQKEETLAHFEFRFGLKNEDVGNLVSYFDGFIQHAVTLTNEWYHKTLEKKHNEDSQSGSRG